ncbi:hypothetical protein [Leptospira idonii]|uniref:Uncharacterized protein n=1 Tax=Leptospira idonii TaxID=1193500 RepID=A0A4R9M1L7_9LEPT|nr:hypothetical protein [Leptospira idonii]TGN20664.1 hypothetical protein EHS15_02045 [Leptospira idonii]
MIEISKDYELKSFGRFSEDFAFPVPFKDRAAELTRCFKEIGSDYLNHLGDDGKVTGLEKKSLVQKMEDLLLIVIMLRRIDFAPGQDNVLIEKSNQSFRLELRFIDKAIWSMSGIMQPEYQMKNRNFKDWFNNQLSADIKKFISLYGEAVADKVLTPEEKSVLCYQLDILVIEIIEMIVYVERFMLFL